MRAMIIRISINSIKRASVFALASFFLFNGTVRAEEIIISGNGSGSDNQVAAQSTNTTAVQQNNSSNIENNVSVSSDTGNNTASGNTNGDTSITTGDASTAVTIDNQTNASNVQTDCCPAGNSQSKVANNGAGSENAVSFNNSNTTAVNVNQTANITTNVSGVVNTGNNSGSFNNGNINIKTGNISVYEQITNGPINVSSVSVPAGSSLAINSNIVGNGSYSTNDIATENVQTTNVSINNAANIINNSVWKLITGNNDADYNRGNVDIFTGNIKVIAKVLNGPINVSNVEVKCCDKKEEEKPHENPTGGVTPATPPANQPKEESKPSENKSSGNGKGGEVLGEAIQRILPATGNFSFLLLFLGNGALFLLGVILRLRSGNSPGTQIAL